MNLEDEDISNKSQMLTLILCLLFGRFGIHRIYVGRYVSGVFYFIIGSTPIAFNLFGFGYAMIFTVIYLFLISFDVFALYSDTFTDSKGKIIGESKILVYDTLQQREQILAEQKLNKIICILISIAAYIVYFVVTAYVF